MANQIDFIWDEGQPQGLEASLAPFVEALLERLSIHNWEFSLRFCDDQTMTEYNREYRDKDSTTDVLSFVMEEGEPFPVPEALHNPGDLLLSLDQVERQAPDFNQTREKELKRVVVHGILHLKGMTHQGYDWSCEMLQLQEQVLEELKDWEITGWE